MKKVVALIVVSLLILPVTAASTPHFSIPKKYFKQPTAGLFTPRPSGIAQGNYRQQTRFRTGHQRGHSKKFGSQRGRFQRFRSRGQGFNNQFNRGFNRNNRFSGSGRFNNFDRGFNRNSRFSGARRFNSFGGGFIPFPGYGFTLGGRVSTNSQPSLTISNKQLQLQRQLGVRAQNNRNFGNRFKNTYGFESILTKNKKPGISSEPPVNISKTTSNRSKTSLQRWNPRKLKKTNPTRGVISSIPMTNRQKARLNF